MRVSKTNAAIYSFINKRGFHNSEILGCGFVLKRVKFVSQIAHHEILANLSQGHTSRISLNLAL
ncbi:hypothetical protein [Helicobacter sp. MIT 05-5294]|uniref:hypothetical protein n=1 Tax=Helicobacter sp. MIT 05-5294 TaxID=1548150 RepID=UPI0010FD957E|nr:hypothetical protein [Helicobacter sp. MIT 05-5294]TLD86525.1 hypothetical protein LS69_005865 [Helicobacter sp. MIT 05-5294]